jgi:cytochrome c oxidase subunit 1
MMFVGFNLTFGPMHILGLQGMPRRIYRWDSGNGWDFWNMASTVGAFLIAASFLVFILNWTRSKRAGEPAGVDPWDARTLEWTTTSPPVEHNFDEVPLVHARDELWHRKYSEDKGGRPVPVPTGGAPEAEHGPPQGHGGHAIHMPDPSYWPLVAALGLPILAYGVMFKALPGIIIGAVVMLAGFYGWVLEPSAE